MALVRQLVVAVCVSACAHTVSNEQRLDGATEATVDSSGDVNALRCRDTSPEIRLARDATVKHAERLARYQSAVEDAKSTSARFDEVFRKDPDLVYGADAGEWKRRQSFCNELAVTLAKEQSRLELEPEPAKVEAAPVVAKASAADDAFDAKPAPARAVKKPAKKPAAEVATASAADEAFGDDADGLRSAYKKNAKLTKAKWKHKKKLHLAAR